MARRHAGARDSAGVQLSPLLQNPGPAPKGEHVDVGAGLAQITLSGLPQSLWPRLLRGFAPARWRVSTVRP
eukprot:4991113-Pyramimonas_sp.AAC.1